MDNISRETFDALSEIYIENKGNSHVKGSLIPFVKSLPILGIDIDSAEDAKSWCENHGVFVRSSQNGNYNETEKTD